MVFEAATSAGAVGRYILCHLRRDVLRKVMPAPIIKVVSGHGGCLREGGVQ